MLRSATVADAVAKHGIRKSVEFEITDMIGRVWIEDEGPLAFLVRSPPDSVLQAHFHTLPQFQVFTAGDAWFGRHPVRPGSVHYADGYSPYGPIRGAGEAWHTYCTLRPYWERSIHYVPEEIELAKGRRGRSLTGHAAAPGARRPGLRDLFVEPDGVSAREFVARAGERIPALGGAGYYLVLDGEVIFGGETLPFESCLWADADDAPNLQAGPAGAVLVLLTFARKLQRPAPN